MNDMTSPLHKTEFPRSNRYDDEWIMDNQMGPNALWLTEYLCEKLQLHPGMRVLDLGCGRAMTSIFLAKEFNVRVWASDLWISPDQNWQRVVDMGMEDLVYPLRAEAHALPFAKGFFDAVVSIDSYQYFGTDELYLGYISSYIRAGGTIGIVVPGLMCMLDRNIPEHLTQPQSNGKAFWEDECWSFKSAEWWRESWNRHGKVANVHVDTMPDGWRHWRDFERALEKAGKNVFPSDAEALEADKGSVIGFVRAVATRTNAHATDLYDPSIGIRVGVDS
jgi:cyclopropane fatty-acyl-phospholipid synthase-like methyltransferase